MKKEDRLYRNTVRLELVLKVKYTPLFAMFSYPMNFCEIMSYRHLYERHSWRRMGMRQQRLGAGRGALSEAALPLPLPVGQKHGNLEVDKSSLWRKD